jgi:formylglycine-generating enzyme required for sulfatase activity
MLCVLRVTDDDGNQPVDSLWFEIIKGPQFVLIPAGKLVRRDGDTVAIQSFWMMTTEVTQSQYHSFLDLASLPSVEDADKPMSDFGPFEAERFCNAFSSFQDRSPVYGIAGSYVEEINSEAGYRLPTQDEWEYAARAGNNAPYWQSIDSASLNEDTWYAGNSGGIAHPVGTKKANPFGLYDMNGNVSEYTIPKTANRLVPSIVPLMGSNYLDDYKGKDLTADFTRAVGFYPNPRFGFRMVLDAR